jgi:hypothetical protein
MQKSILISNKVAVIVIKEMGNCGGAPKELSLDLYMQSKKYIINQRNH